ncbi:MAG: hypothetical protein JWO17_1424 [Actinomycetia bacterium]|jgi:hypothetical protein|nr:hypothetical protein [Actinomycetes bacterium]
MKKNINFVAVIMFALALASILGKVKPGYGFSSGG